MISFFKNTDVNYLFDIHWNWKTNANEMSNFMIKYETWIKNWKEQGKVSHTAKDSISTDPLRHRRRTSCGVLEPRMFGLDTFESCGLQNYFLVTLNNIL